MFSSAAGWDNPERCHATALHGVAARRGRCCRLRFVVVVFATALAVGSCCGSQAHVELNLNDVQTTSFEGWGTSLCWWANAFGDGPHADTIADLLFTTSTVQYNGSAVPGLGMNIVRYNVGGSNPEERSFEQTTSSPMPLYKRVPALQGPPAEGSTSGTWNLAADHRQVDMLQKAYRRGATTVEFFSNSPPWWMCTNGTAAGSDTGGDNLLPHYAPQFAEYLAQVCAHAEQSWGIPVHYIEPFNEPRANWWKYPVKQEGCAFGVGRQGRVIEELSKAIQRLNLRTQVAASDENSVDQALDTWRKLSGTARNHIAKVNVHGYYGLAPYRGEGRPHLRREAGRRKLWQSEYGDGDISGRALAEQIILDLNHMGADGWAYWQAVDGANWGLVKADYRTTLPLLLHIQRKYFVFAHFSRHIQPGSRILRTGRSDLVAAKSPGGERLTLVHLSSESTEPLRVKLPSDLRTSEVAGFQTMLEENAAARRYDAVQLVVTSGTLHFPGDGQVLTTIELRLRE